MEKRQAEGSFILDFFVTFWGNAKKKKENNTTKLFKVLNVIPFLRISLSNLLLYRFLSLLLS
jgi:hypothetical protein